MNREAFLSRMRDIVLRAGTTDGPALISMLERNCHGVMNEATARAVCFQFAQTFDRPELWADTRRHENNYIAAVQGALKFEWQDTMPAYETIEHATAMIAKRLTSPEDFGPGARYITCVKLYKTLTDVGLKEAKDAVDALIERLGLVRSEIAKR